MPDSDEEEDERLDLETSETTPSREQDEHVAVKIEATTDTGEVESQEGGTSRTLGGLGIGLRNPAPSNVYPSQILEPEQNPFTERSVDDEKYDEAAERNKDRGSSHHSHADEGPDGGSPDSVGNQLQAEIDSGLRTIDELLRESREKSQAGSNDGSRSSSPLSSVISFPSENDVASPDGRTKSGDHLPSIPGQAVPHFGSLPTILSRTLGRELRHRNPIQLHPYAIEDARYQQTLRARGLNPVRISTINAERHRSPTAFESQEQDVFSSSPIDDSLTTNASANIEETRDNPIPAKVRHMHAGSKLTRTLDDEDNVELPDVSTILQGSHAGHHPGMRKRRKLVHISSSSKGSRQPVQDDYHSYDLPTGNVHDDHAGDRGREIFEVPPSPPNSINSHNYKVTPVTTDDHFRMSIRGLPTPVVSSVTRHARNSVIEIQSSSVSSQEPAEESDRSIDSPWPELPSQGHRGIEKIQRRIKGVLPASWLKLDLKKQSNKTTIGRHGPDSPIKQIDAKGVAQKSKKAGIGSLLAKRSRDLAFLDIDGSSSAGDSSGEELQRKEQIFETPNFEDDMVDVWADDMEEDNRVDAMAPPISRRLSGVRKGEIGRTKVDHAFPRNRLLFEQKSSGLVRRPRKRRTQPRIAGEDQRRSTHRRQRQEQTIPPLGILDAPGFVQLRGNDKPWFLKIAARQARSRKDKGRQSPSRKYLQLATPADTAEANTELVNWLQHRIKPMQGGQSSISEHESIHVPLSDSGLLPHNANRSALSTIPSLLTAVDQLSSLKTSTEATIKRILVRQAGTASSAHTRAPPSVPHSTDSSSHHPRIQSSLRQLPQHPNRAGLGNLFSSIARPAGPRTAQLEDIKKARHQTTSSAIFHAGLTSLEQFKSHPTSTSISRPGSGDNSVSSPLQADKAFIALQ